MSCKNSGEDNDEVFISPSKQQFQKAMNDNLNGELVNNKILGYSQKPPELQEGEIWKLVILFWLMLTYSNLVRLLVRILYIEHPWFYNLVRWHLCTYMINF